MREFDNFASFEKFIEEKCLPRIPHTLERVVTQIGDDILERTKDQIGHYLEGPESGLPTAKLAEKTIENRLSLGFTPDDPGYRDGSMMRSYMRAVETHSFTSQTVIGSEDKKAYYFELGRPGQPARPELNVAIQRESKHGIEKVRAAVGGVLAGKV